MTYELTVIELDERYPWQRYAQSAQWGQTEPHWLADGEQVGKNVVVVEVDSDDVELFETSLDRDGNVLSYCELV